MHHTIVAVDVERFGGRDGSHQTRVRNALYATMEEAFERCGLSWNACHTEDRGDGLLVLLPPDADNRRLAECLPNELAGRLREHIEHDRPGYSGPAVVDAFRLLDAKALRRALRRSRGVLALITSTEFFRDVIDRIRPPTPASTGRSGSRCDGTSFRPTLPASGAVPRRWRHAPERGGSTRIEALYDDAELRRKVPYLDELWGQHPADEETPHDPALRGPERRDPGTRR